MKLFRPKSKWKVSDVFFIFLAPHIFSLCMLARFHSGRVVTVRKNYGCIWPERLKPKIQDHQAVSKQFQAPFDFETVQICKVPCSAEVFFFEIVSMQYENSRSVLTFSDNKTFAFWGKFAFSLFWWKWDFIQRHIWSEIWTACNSCSSCSSSQKYKIQAATHKILTALWPVCSMSIAH